MRTLTPEQSLAFHELEMFVTDYWYEVDFNDAQNLTEFYTPDCTYYGGQEIKYNGRDGITKFYENSRSLKAGKRISRHMATGVRPVLHDKNRATVTYELVTYGAWGQPPLEVDFNPQQITDIRIECVRGEGGRWYIATFHGQPIMYSPNHLTKKLAGWNK